MGKVIAGEVVPMVGYELIAMGFQRVGRYLFGNFVELDAILHIYESQQAIFAPLEEWNTKLDHQVTAN